MKTKIIPFNAKMAKDIQDGKIEGKIKTRDKQSVRIVCWDRMDDETPIIALIQFNDWEGLFECNSIGEYTEGHGDDARLMHLVLEVHDNEPQFKPFDKVLVRDLDKSEWRPRLYSRKGNVGYCTQDGCEYMQILPYEGNEYLVGTAAKPEIIE